MLLLLVLLRAARPQAVNLKVFCTGSIEASGNQNGCTAGVQSRKWEFVRKAGGGHDAPENTLAAIMQVRAGWEIRMSQLAVL